MEIIVYIILALFVVRLIIVAANFITSPIVPRGQRLKEDILISIIIRADTESPKLTFLLELLNKINNDHIEIIIGMYNPVGFKCDNLLKITEKDKKVRLIDITKLKKGWKENSQINYKLCNYARGNYSLFLDPNIEVRGGILEQLIFLMKQNKIQFITLFPYYDLHKKVEWLTLPILNNICLSSFPFWKILNSTNFNYALASDYFMFFEGNTYRQYQPFDKELNLRNAYEIARYLKKEEVKIDFFIADKRVRLLGELNLKRCMSESITELLLYVRRGTLPFVTLFSFILIVWWIFFLIFGFYKEIAWGVIILFITQSFIARLTNTSWTKNMMFMIPQFVMVFYVSVLALIHQIKKKIFRKTKYI